MIQPLFIVLFIHVVFLSLSLSFLLCFFVCLLLISLCLSLVPSVCLSVCLSICVYVVLSVFIYFNASGSGRRHYRPAFLFASLWNCPLAPFPSEIFAPLSLLRSIPPFRPKAFSPSDFFPFPP